MLSQWYSQQSSKKCLRGKHERNTKKNPQILPECTNSADSQLNFGGWKFHFDDAWKFVEQFFFAPVHFFPASWVYLGIYGEKMPHFCTERQKRFAFSGNNFPNWHGTLCQGWTGRIQTKSGHCTHQEWSPFATNDSKWFQRWQMSTTHLINTKKWIMKMFWTVFGESPPPGNSVDFLCAEHTRGAKSFHWLLSEGLAGLWPWHRVTPKPPNLNC